MRAPLPSVTALICTYNYAAHLGEALESVLGQDYPADRLDVIVVDDGSTDRTPELLAEYAAAHPGRIRVIEQANAGVAAAAARGLAEAKGDLIALLDADDAWLPHKTRRQVELLRARPDAGLVHGDLELVDRDGRTLAPSYWHQHDLKPQRGRVLAHILRANSAIASTVMLRREHVASVLPYPQAAWSHDWWIAARVAAVAPIDFIAEPLARHRSHDGQMTRDFVKTLRRNVVLQRHMLRRLDLGTLAPREARGAWEAVWDAARLAQRWTGRPFAEEIAVADADRREWTALMLAAGAAAAAGDDAGAARAYVAALACDPFAAAARDGLDAVADAELNRAAPDADLLPAAAQALVGEAREALQAGEVDRAAHHLRRALNAAPGHPLLLNRLAETEHARGRWADAAALWRQAGGDEGPAPREAAAAADAELRAASTGPASAADAELRAASTGPASAADAELRAATGPAAAADIELRAAAPGPAAEDVGAADRGRLLLASDAFPPARDGSEGFAVDLALALAGLGWEVEVVTRGHHERTALTHRGIPVHEIVREPVEELQAVVARRSPAAVIALSSPLGWPVVGSLKLPSSGPKVLAAIALDRAVEAELRGSLVGLATFRTLLARASAVVSLTRSGPDARLLADLGVPATHIPVATAATAPAAAPALAGDAPLLVAAGDLAPANGYGALLRALSHRAGDWQVVIAGRGLPRHRDVETELRRMASADKRVTLLADATPEATDALIARAAAVLAPAVTDAFAPSLATAARHATPWIATPGSAGAHDRTGGIVTGVERFPDAVELLLDDPGAAARLGAAGRDGAIDLRAVAARYDALLRGIAVAPQLAVAAAAVAATDAARSALLERIEDAVPAFRPEEAIA